MIRHLELKDMMVIKKHFLEIADTSKVFKKLINNKELETMQRYIQEDYKEALKQDKIDEIEQKRRKQFLR